MSSSDTSLPVEKSPKIFQKSNRRNSRTVPNVPSWYRTCSVSLHVELTRGGTWLRVLLGKWVPNEVPQKLIIYLHWDYCSTFWVTEIT